MRLRSSRIIQRGLGAGGMAALLLAIGSLGGDAAGQQQGATPPPRKDQPVPAKKQGRGAEEGRLESSARSSSGWCSTIRRRCKATP